MAGGYSKIADCNYPQYEDLVKKYPDRKERTKIMYQTFMKGYLRLVTSLDNNIGKLLDYIDKKGLRENTILIFMTDNGSSGGAIMDGDGFVTRGYNAGMRGRKGSYYEGGHRFPFFIRWPAVLLSRFVPRQIDPTDAMTIP